MNIIKYTLATLCLVSSVATCSATPSVDLDINAYIDGQTKLYLNDLNHKEISDSWRRNEVKTLHIDAYLANSSNSTLSIKLPVGLKFHTNPTELVNGVTLTDVDLSNYKNQTITSTNGHSYTPDTGIINYSISKETKSLSMDILISIDEVFWDTVENSASHNFQENAIEVKLSNAKETTTKKIDKLYTKGKDWIPYNSSQINEYVHLDKAEFMKNHVTLDYVQNTVSRFYKDITIKMEIPYTLKNGEKVYSEIENVNLTNNGTFEIYDSYILLNWENTSISRLDFSLNLIFNSKKFSPNELLQYKSGEVWVSNYFDGKQTNVRAATNYSFRISPEEENITISSRSKKVVKTSNNEVVSHMGRFSIFNAGNISSEKELIFEFSNGKDSDIGVTTVRIPTSKDSQTINLNYILWQKSTLKEVTGTITIDKKASSENFHGHLINISQLLKNENLLDTDFYIKKLSYKQKSFPLNYRSWSTDGPDSVYSSGNFFGVNFKNSKLNVPSTSSLTLRSNKEPYTQSISAITTLSETGESVSSITNFAFYDLANRKITNVKPGREYIMKGDFSAADYPYFSTTYLENPVIYVRLPKGLTINKDLTKFQSISASKTEPLKYNLNSKGRLLNDGSLVYEITLESNLGYYTQILGQINRINFEIGVDIDKSLKTTSINARESLFVSDKKLTITGSGSYDAYFTKDKWDINNNGNTSDRICTIRDDTYLSINTNTNSLFTDTSISINNSNYSRLPITLNKKNDNINLKFSIENVYDGYVEANNFHYYIPIPKTNLKYNEYAKNPSETFNFSMALKKFLSPKIGFEIQYSTNNIDFVEENQIKNINDVSMIYIKSTKKIQKDHKTDFIIPLTYIEGSLDYIGYDNTWSTYGYQVYSKGESQNSFIDICTQTTISINKPKKPTILSPTPNTLFNAFEPFKILWENGDNSSIIGSVVCIKESTTDKSYTYNIFENLNYAYINGLPQGSYNITISSYNDFGVFSKSDSVNVRIGVFQQTGKFISKTIETTNFINYIALKSDHILPKSSTIKVTVYYKTDSNDNILLINDSEHSFDIELNSCEDEIYKLPNPTNKLQLKFDLKSTNQYQTPIIDAVEIFVK